MQATLSTAAPRRPKFRALAHVLVGALSACAAATTTSGGASSLPPIGVTEAPGTLPPTLVAPAAGAAATSTTIAATAPAPPPTTPAAAPTTTTAPGAPPPDLTKSSTWPVAGSVVGDNNASIIVYSAPKGPVCVGIRVVTGDERDACDDLGQSWYAVVQALDRLYVVAGRAPGAHLVVNTTAGVLDVAPLPAGATAPRPFAVAAVALARGAAVVSVDDGEDQSGCSYSGLLAALATSGAIGDLGIALRIEQCGPSAAFAGLLGGSRNPQGAGALFDRAPDSGWELVSIGGDVCTDPAAIDPATVTDAQRAAIARAASGCRALGR